MAGSTTAVVAASVRNDGLVLVYGALAGFKLELGVADLLFRSARVHGFWCAATNPALPKILPCRSQYVAVRHARTRVVGCIPPI